MRKEFLEEIVWELSSVSRYPVLEILVGFFSFTAMLSFMGNMYTVESQCLRALEGKYWLHVELAWSIIVPQPIIIFLISAVLAATLFTRALEAGYLRDEFSLPVTRTSIFMAKFLAAFLLLFLSIITAVVVCLLFLDPAGWAITVLSPSMAKVIIFILTEIALPLSISTLLSVLGKNSFLSTISSFLFLMGLYFIARATFLSWIIMPYTFEVITSPSNETIKLIAVKWGISLLLVGVSCYYFERRVEA
ncbi:MAG: hypothetical protein DSO07_06525 [Thermoproteota archaeon]|jgi:ABC-2 type transport system permease protein|uniref:Uncharacterized protein n=1 Tax=Candidatus Methanodesulfokora washburnensis TaxID=2478471 RepID=A0A3R9PFL0_9CREN|nr:hypothetical protein [Candidatus Methanodesulfokores washburnensis]RSN73079.1 hypothetical protein D6D85_11325 [Candidatus Methanodesulfokores washburnensis]RZN59246.1 MAG: hypothetical protein EF810_06925 [Candidatus Methanodesulfokores washburnensis]TDA41058.1 MAG: hypothetical protein DSO07_06525 [Candidatus Korarchaeota archaeon]